jgi:hypothetical protein
MSQWNTLSVPMGSRCQCKLVKASGYRSESGDTLQFIRDKDELSQLEQDRQEFDRYFRPRWDLRSITGAADLGEVQSFLRDLLYVPHWNLPKSNADVERILRRAVADGWLVPIVNRESRSLGRVSRPTPAPEGWPTEAGGGGGRRSAYLFPPGTTSFEGEPVLSGQYDPLTREAQILAARGSMTASNGGGKPLGVLETVADAVLGGVSGEYGTDKAGGGPSLTGEDGGAATPLDDADPFEYTPDTLSGDVEELAKSTTNERYAAKMLGYDLDTFGGMIHGLKAEYGLRGDDNVTFHDSGDIYFNGDWLDNIHTYAP